jgi:uncharacterized protein (TIGR02569 family)
VTTPPPDAVLLAFGLGGRPELLPGGQGQTFAVGDAVLKPAGGDAAWAAGLVVALPEDGFRLPRPRPRIDGTGWVVDGWVAWERVAGEHRTWGADWPAAVDVAHRLHLALRSAPPPPDRRARRDVFAVADRMAWGEQPLPDTGPLAAVLARLGAARAPVDQREQVVHGDVAGNLLWLDDAPPAVIDLSPYWRPGGLGAALVVVDATLWYGADGSLLDHLLGHEPEHGRQLVLRGLLFRLAVDALLESSHSDDVRWDRAQVAWDLEHAAPLLARVLG